MPFSVEVPEPLATELEERAERSEFGSTEAYVLFVLREVTKPHEELEYSETDTEGGREDEVYDRLESLGYVE